MEAWHGTAEHVGCDCSLLLENLNAEGEPPLHFLWEYPMTEREIKFMKEAIKEARKAAKINEVPIGCVIVYEDRIIGRGYNRRMTDRTALAHAEISAIKKACRFMGDWRLDDTEIYITLEPCQMCAGAIVQSRIRKVFIGAMNPKAGCAGSILDLLHVKEFNHQCMVETGLLEEECAKLLTDFFAGLRKKSADPVD